MFKKIALVCFGFAGLLSVQAQEKKSDRETSGLSGYVKSIKEEEARIISQQGKLVEKDRTLDSTETFDINGKQTSYAFYSSYKNELLADDTKIYDDKGRLIEVRTKHSPNLNLNDKKIYKYDENDRLIEEAGYDSSGNLNGRRTYVYNSLGQLVEETSENGPKKERFYNNYITRYKYDAAGRQIEKATYKKVGVDWQPEDFRVGFYKQIYLYNTDGKRIGEIRIGADEKVYRISTTDYSRKNEEEYTEFNPDGTVRERTKYVETEFDEQGNWTKQIRYEWITEDGKSAFQPIEATYRQIVYFTADEIIQFEKTKPASKETTSILQNTDREEYAVYERLFKDWQSSDIKLIVVTRFTEYRDLSELVRGTPFSVKDVEKEVTDDFFEKNYRKNYQLLEALFPNPGKIVLAGDAESREIFSASDEGWNVFYQKYPKSQGFTTVSRVGFNKDKTKALVYIGTQRHFLNGEGFFVVLEKTKNGWQVTEQRMLWIS